MINIDKVFDPKTDLRIERTIDVKPELVWEAWTKPEHLMKWFTPAPWKTVDCELDVRPGGIFRTTMESPEGQQFPNSGCYLEVVENKRLTFTDGLGPGFRPNAESFMTAILELEPAGDGTRYLATAIHNSEEDRKKHEEMGFEHGWNAALDQLIAYVKSW